MNFLDAIATRSLSIRARPPALKSEKAPKGALATTGWQSADEPILERYSSHQAIKKVYEGNVYAYRCVDAIANSIVSCAFRAGDAVSNNYRLSSPLARLLGPAPGSPNPMMSSAILLRHAIASYMLLGKFAWAIERDAVGRIIGLWPLRAQDVHPVPASSGSNYFKYFKYGNVGAPDYVEYKPEDLVYIWKPSLADFRLAESPVNVAALNINVHKLLDVFDFNFLKNDGKPAHLVITPPWATDTDREGFQQQFLSDFGGPYNAGKTLFAERSIEGEGATDGMETVDVKILGTNQRDAQLDKLRDAEIMAITVAFGVPLSILGDSSHRTFSNAFQDRRNYWLETLLPRSREIQDGINTHLAPLLGKEVGWFDTTGVPELRPEPAIPYQVAEAWVRAGIVKKDELRADVGLPPAEDVGLSPELTVEGGTTVGDNASDSLAKEAGTKVVPPQKAPVATAPAASRQVAQNGPPETRDDTVSVLEPVLVEQVANLMNEQLDSVRRRAAGRRTSRDLYDAEFWTERTISSLGPVLGAMGLSEEQIRQFATEVIHVNKEILNRGVESEEILTEVFDSRRGPIVEAARAKLREGRVPVSDVKRALLDIYRGDLSLEVALAGLGVLNGHRA